MKTTALLVSLASLILASCAAPKAFPVGPTPLSLPGAKEPTVKQLHDLNAREITGNKCLHPETPDENLL